jgi:hypothetical protein
VIEGRAVLYGESATTTLVGAETASAEPAEFVAVTRTLIVAPTSAEPRASLAEDALAIATQDAPARLQRSHW